MSEPTMPPPGSWEDAHRFVVAAYFPGQGGYGGSTSFETLDLALDCAARMRSKGYIHVHVKKVTVKVIQYDEGETR